METFSKNSLKNERGSAMVEFSILMLVFVPMLTYGFYLMDLGHHLLDLQETVLSTTWDYTSRTYEGTTDTSASNTALDNVFHANRFEYIDHTSAYDDFNDLQSQSDEKKYHFEMGSKAAWIAGKGLGSGAGESKGLGSVGYDNYKSDYAADDSRQITCAVNPGADLGWMVGGAMANEAAAFGNTSFARGGVVTCWAKLHVYNYVIPEKFLQDHSAVDMTKSKYNQQSQDVEKLTDSAKPITLKDHAAVSFGTWALNDGDSGLSKSTKIGNTTGDIFYCPKSDNPFYERVVWMFTGDLLGGTINPVSATYGMWMGSAMAFMGEAMGDELEMPLAIPSMVGSTDGSPEGFSCPTMALMESMGGRPANILGVNLVARHDRSKGLAQSYKTGDSMDGSSMDMDFISGKTPGYESSPASTNYTQAHDSSRGPYYLGEQNDNG